MVSDCSMSSTATTSTLAVGGAGGAQQVQPRRVAVEDPEAERARRLSIMSASWSSTVSVRPCALSRRPMIWP